MCTHGNKYVTLRNLTGNEPVGDAVDLASMVTFLALCLDGKQIDVVIKKT